MLVLCAILIILIFCISPEQLCCLLVALVIITFYHQKYAQVKLLMYIHIVLCYYGDGIDVFRQLMQGMEHHMSNPIVDQRLVAMRLAECVSQKIIKDGKPLKFDVRYLANILRSCDINRLMKIMTPFYFPPCQCQ